jgi:hypothetical protein
MVDQTELPFSALCRTASSAGAPLEDARRGLAGGKDESAPVSGLIDIAAPDEVAGFLIAAVGAAAEPSDVAGSVVCSAG